MPRTYDNLDLVIAANGDAFDLSVSASASARSTGRFVLPFAPLEFTDHLGMPMRESLLFVQNSLVGAGMRSQIKVGAAGKIVSAFDIATAMALGPTG